MIQVGDVVVSLDVFREKFICNLKACKGECCIEGDAGAPVDSKAGRGTSCDLGGAFSGGSCHY